MTANATDPPLASQGRRLAGAVLDVLIFVLTLGIGWVIWYLVAARGGQSPAKRLLGTRVIREDGAVASLSWMLIRDLAVRVIALRRGQPRVGGRARRGGGRGDLRARLRRGGAVVRVGREPPVPLGQDRADARRVRPARPRQRLSGPPRDPARSPGIRWDPLGASAYTCSDSTPNLAEPVGEQRGRAAPVQPRASDLPPVFVPLPKLELGWVRAVPA